MTSFFFLYAFVILRATGIFPRWREDTGGGAEEERSQATDLDRCEAGFVWCHKTDRLRADCVMKTGGGLHQFWRRLTGRLQQRGTQTRKSDGNGRTGSLSGFWQNFDKLISKVLMCFYQEKVKRGKAEKSISLMPMEHLFRLNSYSPNFLILSEMINCRFCHFINQKKIK